MTEYCDFCYEKERFPTLKQENEQLKQELKNTFIYNKKIVAGLVADKDCLKQENERLKEMMITRNEKIDDLRRINKKLKAKLENTERKIRAISQKCYEVENIESIITDLDNLSMEIEE